ncbi:hypothetical protein MAHJHV51_47210 [Mycobacterium avium subsp. hominissuis]
MAGPDRRAAVPDVTVTGVTLRAQDVLPGDLFAALDRLGGVPGAVRRRTGQRGEQVAGQHVLGALLSPTSPSPA